MISRVVEIIRKVGPGKYVLYSHSGKRLTKPMSLAKVKKRERQIQFFKHRKAKGRRK